MKHSCISFYCTLLYCASQILYFAFLFFFLTFAHFVSLYYILEILKIFQASPLLLYL